MAAVPGLAAVVFPARAQVWSAETVDRYLDYRKLSRLTASPIDVVEKTSRLCSIPQSGPHLQPAIHLYANAIAVDSRRDPGKAGKFAVGSLLVKEKFMAPGLGKPALITVMEKTGDKGGITDWRFLMIRLPEGKVVPERPAASCIQCHRKFSGTGFVSGETAALLADFAAVRKDAK